MSEQQQYLEVNYQKTHIYFNINLSVRIVWSDKVGDSSPTWVTGVDVEITEYKTAVIWVHAEYIYPFRGQSEIQHTQPHTHSDLSQRAAAADDGWLVKFTLTQQTDSQSYWI